MLGWASVLSPDIARMTCRAKWRGAFGQNGVASPCGLTPCRVRSRAVSSDGLEEAARLYESAADELDQAAQHGRTAARHFRDREVPRAAAHAWAAFGHVLVAEDSLHLQARTHAEKSTP